MFEQLEQKMIRRNVLAWISKDEGALECMSTEITGDRKVMLTIIGWHGATSFSYATEELRGEYEFTLNAVKLGGGRALRYASEELRGNREFMLAAVASDGHSLKYASEELKGDREVVQLRRMEKR